MSTLRKCPGCGSETTKDVSWLYRDLWRKSGTHPLITQYNSLVDQMKALEVEFESLKHKTKQPSAQYGEVSVKVQMESIDSFISRGPKIEILRITSRLSNPQAKEAYMKKWGSINGLWEESRTSVAYYRNPEGILTFRHGGWLLLQGLPTMISDEEWTSMKAGNIPERLLETK